MSKAGKRVALLYQHIINELICFPVGCLPLVFIPGFLLLGAGAANVTNWQTAKWHKAPGRITQFDGDGPQQTKDGPQYLVLVNYNYNINGQTYAGDSFNLDKQDTVNEEEFAALVRKYPIGKKVSIYYNPSNPDESVLELSYGRASQMMLIGGVICLVSLILTAANRKKLSVGETN